MLEEVARDTALRPTLRDWEAVRTLVYQNKGRKARALFDRELTPDEKLTVTGIRREGSIVHLDLQ